MQMKGGISLFLLLPKVVGIFMYLCVHIYIKMCVYVRPCAHARSVLCMGALPRWGVILPLWERPQGWEQPECSARLEGPLFPWTDTEI